MTTLTERKIHVMFGVLADAVQRNGISGQPRLRKALELSDDLLIVARGKSAHDRQIDAGADCASRAVHEQEVAASHMGRVVAGRTAVRSIQRVLPVVDNHGGNCGSPVLAGRQSRVVRERASCRVVDHFLTGNDARPSTLHKAAVAFANPEGIGQAIRDIRGADTHIAMEYAIERLVLVATIVRITPGHPAAEIANVAGPAPVRQNRWRI